MRLNFAHYIDCLSTDLLRSYAAGTSHIRLHTDLDELAFDVDITIPCGLILHELLTNALKYAFPDSRQGEIRIELRGKNDGAFTVVVADDGIGIPEHIDFRNTESLGLQVVCTLVEQLGGMIDMERGPGTRFSMTFSAPA